MRTQTEWKVPAQMLFATSSSLLKAVSKRVFISFAALFVKVMARTAHGGQGSQINSGSVKCICSFPDGSAARTVATDVYASHDTDRFKLFEISGTTATSKDFVFDGRAFYKARSFYAEYN